MDKIEKAIIHLLSHEGTFYAEFFIRARRVEAPLPPNALMAMGVKNGRLYLYTHLPVIEHLTVEQTARGLQHEALHWIMEHGLRCEGRDPEKWNIAGDLAINCLIPGMDIGLIPGQGEFKGWKTHETADYYFNKLPKGNSGGCPQHGPKGQGQGQGQGQGSGQGKSPGQGQGKGKGGGYGQGNQPGQGQGNCNCQPGQGNGDGPNCSGARQAMSDFDKEIIRRTVQDAADAHSKSHGHLPSNIQQAVERFLKPPQVNWKVLLRQFVAASVKAENKRTWRKENRRGLPIKGAMRVRRPKIVLALDTSGSIFGDPEQLAEFYNEIYGIQKAYNADIDVIECDAEVGASYKLKRTSKMPEPTGGGGTAFEPVFVHVKEKKMKVDLLIYFTDLYGSFPKRETVRTLWLVCKGGADKVPFGRMIKMGGGN